MAKHQSIRSDEIHAAITQLANAIAERHQTTPRLLLLGIANGGLGLAQRLARELAPRIPGLAARSGSLDISFHRDDFERNPIPKEYTPTHLPADVNGASVVLVDDVLFTGRTVKAALDELFDHGRPARVELAVLADRGGRRLPLAPDYCGLQIQADESERVVVQLSPDDPAQDLLRVEPLARKRTVSL